jgi:hypothetical protein
MKSIKILLFIFVGLILLFALFIVFLGDKEKYDCLNSKGKSMLETYSSTKNDEYTYSEIRENGFFHKNEKIEILLKPSDLTLNPKKLLIEKKGTLAFFYISGEKSCKILIDTKIIKREDADVFLNGIPYKINEATMREEKITPKSLFKKIDCAECDEYGPFENIK